MPPRAILRRHSEAERPLWLAVKRQATNCPSSPPPPVPQPVPFYDISLRLGGFFSELRDQHVSPFGGDPIINRVLNTIDLRLIDIRTGNYFQQSSPDLIQAKNVMISTGLLEPANCVFANSDGSINAEANCTKVWLLLMQRAEEALPPMLEDPSLFDADALATLLGVLKDGMVGFQPLNSIQKMGDDFIKGNPFKPPVQRTRGGMVSLYSQAFHVDKTSSGGKLNISAHEEAGLPSPYVSPFKSVLAISDGMCGSTCSTWGITSWLHSKTTPGADSFKWLTYGGTGKRDNIQPTSFAGGFLPGSTSGKPEMPKLWAYWAFFSLVSE
ncbi:hypothetical protein FOA52_008587 [Chlamydomonas sp. UWO 241]|nr:hypothetical protein FOA52_008587 [Chlamydomonas sp. UWO 241]